MNQERIDKGNKIFVGKTIKSIDVKSINSVTLFFTDGTSVILETEAFGSGLYGIEFCSF